MTPQYHMLLERIHVTERNILTSNLFIDGKTQVCLLDFIGASKYFITEFGSIWLRDKIFPNHNQYLSQGWIPMVRRDPTIAIPWVLLVTTVGKIWWPVNQLLGWAFSSYAEKKKKYYLSATPYNWSLSYREYNWADTLPAYTEYSLYTEFMDTLYGE